MYRPTFLKFSLFASIVDFHNIWGKITHCAVLPHTSVRNLTPHVFIRFVKRWQLYARNYETHLAMIQRRHCNENGGIAKIRVIDID